MKSQAFREIAPFGFVNYQKTSQPLKLKHLPTVDGHMGIFPFSRDWVSAKPHSSSRCVGSGGWRIRSRLLQGVVQPFLIQNCNSCLLPGKWFRECLSSFIRVWICVGGRCCPPPPPVWSCLLVCQQDYAKDTEHISTELGWMNGGNDWTWAKREPIQFWQWMEQSSGVNILFVHFLWNC